MNARFVREDAFADDRLVRLDRHARGALDRRPQLVEPLVFEARQRHAVQLPQHHHELVDRGVARPFADAVRRQARMRRAVHHRAHGVHRSQPEVVVEVRRELHAPFPHAQRLDDRREVVVHRFRCEHAARVREAEPLASGRHARLRPLDGIREVAAARILGGEFDALDAAVLRVADGVGNQADVRLAVERQRQVEPARFGFALPLEQRTAEFVLQVQVRDRRQHEDRDVPWTAAGFLHDAQHGIHVAVHRAAHREDVEVGADAALAPRLQDQPQRGPIALRHDGKRHVRHVDPDVCQQDRQFELLVRRECHPGHLLPVAQRVVVQDDRCRIGEHQVPRERLRRVNQRLERLAEVDHKGTIARKVEPAMRSVAGQRRDVPPF